MNADALFAAYCAGYAAVKGGAPVPIQFDVAIQCAIALGVNDAAGNGGMHQQDFVVQSVQDLLNASPDYPRTP